MRRAAPSVLLPLLLLLAPPASSQSDKLYLAAGETEALMAKEGQLVVVHGQAEGSAKSPGGTNFVNFREAEFFLVTFKTDLGQFPDGEPAEVYEGKRLAVEGVVSIYQGKPQIKLTDPAQVTVLAPDAVFPPPRSADDADVPSRPMAEEPAAEPAPEPAKRKPPVDPSEYFKK